jgi:hypothetical protein
MNFAFPNENRQYSHTPLVHCDDHLQATTIVDMPKPKYSAKDDYLIEVKYRLAIPKEVVPELLALSESGTGELDEDKLLDVVAGLVDAGFTKFPAVETTLTTIKRYSTVRGFQARR